MVYVARDYTRGEVFTEESADRMEQGIAEAHQGVEEVRAGKADRAYVEAVTAPILLGRNLLDPSKVAGGMLLNAAGGLVASAAYDTSGPIPVKAGQPYTLWGASVLGSGPERMGPRAWALYDRGENLVEYGGEGTQPVTTITPTVGGYLRASFRLDTVPSPQIEEGSTATAYEPYRVDIAGFSVDTSKIEARVSAAEYAAASTGKWLDASVNLADPSGFVVDGFLSRGSVTVLAGYTTSGFIPVQAGEPYTGTVRMWSWYAADGTFLSEVNTGSNTAVSTLNAPAGAGLMRASWSSVLTPGLQIEHGNAATPQQEFGVRIPDLILDAASAPVEATVTGTAVTLASTLARKRITVSGGPGLRTNANGLYNIGPTYFDGELVHVAASSPDEITPVRTDAGTVGANHGCAMLQAWVSHDKTTADLGSVWSDGAREYTLVALTARGYAHFAPDPDTGAGGEAVIPSTLAGDLTHVSGATNTAPLPGAGASRFADQVYPWVTRKHLAYFADGVRVTAGTVSGSVVEVRESYEIVDYRDVIAIARAHPGEPFSDHAVAGAVRVQITYRYTAGLACVVDTQLTELRPTSLGQCGFVQAVALTGSTVHRTVPGVEGWTTSVDLATHTTNQVAAVADLTVPGVPPVMSLDSTDQVGFALGYLPWAEGVASSTARTSAGLPYFWDLRATGKSYPVAITSAAPGWGRITATAYRAYVAPGDVTGVVRDAADPHAADAALGALTSL